MNAANLEPVGDAVSALHLIELAGSDVAASEVLIAAWQGLISGHLIVTRTSANEDTATLWLEHRKHVSNSARAARVFDAIIAGERQKVVAIDLGVAPSTVTAMLRRVLEGMGLTCPLSRLPLAIPLLRHAAARRQPVVLHCEMVGARSGGPRLVIDLARCDSLLAARLSPSEYAVARQLVEGDSYQQIAAQRNSSVRTIANQVSSVYRKLNSNNRFEVLREAVAAVAPLAEPAVSAPDADPLHWMSSRRARELGLH